MATSQLDGVETPGFGVFVRDGVLVVRLDRTEVGNSLSRAMRKPMRDIWRRANQSDVLAVIVTGSGERHFCTGADVGEIAESGEVPSAVAPDEPIVWSAVANGVRKPVICAVNGLVAGGGLHFVVDADIVVAATTSAFMDTHVSVGQVGAVENIGLTHRLPFGTVMRMTLQGKRFRLTAKRAYELGLVDELVEPDRLMPTALAIAADIASNSPRAVELSRQVLWASRGSSPDEADRAAWRVAQRHWGHPDVREGARAFAEGRTPKWSDANA